MKTTAALLLLLCVTSCIKKSTVKVINKVSNCRIYDISFGEYRINGNLITNDASDPTDIRDNRKSFPKKYPLKFYMESGGNRVVLQTAGEYVLKLEDQLEIVIDDQTPVRVP